MRFISKVPRALDIKTRLWGFEVLDVVVIFLNLSVTNLIFGTIGANNKHLIVWGSTALLALTLFFIKKGKPDSYIMHMIQFWTAPGSYDAGLEDTEYVPYLKKEDLE